jgi:hypothetical protein
MTKENIKTPVAVAKLYLQVTDLATKKQVTNRIFHDSLSLALWLDEKRQTFVGCSISVSPIPIKESDLSN